MVTKHYYPASEQTFYECILCQEAIYNPLCQNCLAQQIDVWLTRYPDLAKKIKPKLKKFVQNINNDLDEAITCAACKEKKAAICPYCFTEFMLGQLRKMQANKQILREFVRFFNFDYDGTGYTSSSEAKAMGII